MIALILYISLRQMFAIPIKVECFISSVLSFHINCLCMGCSASIKSSETLFMIMAYTGQDIVKDLKLLVLFHFLLLASDFLIMLQSQSFTDLNVGLSNHFLARKNQLNSRFCEIKLTQSTTYFNLAPNLQGVLPY